MISFQSMVSGAGCLNNSATMIEITKDVAPIIWSCSTANIFKQDVFKLPMLFGFRSPGSHLFWREEYMKYNFN